MVACSEQGPLTSELSGSHGEVSAQEYERLRKELTRAVRRICPSYLANDAEDLVQQALMKVLSIQRRDETPREFTSSYLWRVAHSAVIDEIRRRQNRGEVALEESHQQRAESSPGPQRLLAGRRLGQALRLCLGEMIAPRRAAILMRIHGHKVSEVAERMGCNVKRAKNLTYRGLDDLKACLQMRGYERESAG